MPDYTVYELTSLQRMLVILGAGVLLFGIGYLFYHRLLLAALLVPGSAYGRGCCTNICCSAAGLR